MMRNGTEEHTTGHRQRGIRSATGGIISNGLQRIVEIQWQVANTTGEREIDIHVDFKRITMCED